MLSVSRLRIYLGLFLMGSGSCFLVAHNMVYYWSKIPKGNLSKQILDTYNAFNSDIFSCSYDQRLKASTAIDCANLFLIESFGHHYYFAERVYNFYENNLSDIVPSVFDTPLEVPGIIWRTATEDELRSEGQEFIKAQRLLKQFPKVAEATNKEMFWKRKHFRFAKAATTRLFKDAEFIKDKEAKAEWKKFCELFDKNSHIYPESKWSLWWLMIPAIVIVGAHVLNRHVQRMRQNKRSSVKDFDALDEDELC